MAEVPRPPGQAGPGFPPTGPAGVGGPGAPLAAPGLQQPCRGPGPPAARGLRVRTGGGGAPCSAVRVPQEWRRAPPRLRFDFLPFLSRVYNFANE